MRERTAWILASATVVASIGTSAVVVSVLAPSPREEAGTASLDGAVLRELTGELARLRSTIEDQERRAELLPARPVDATRRPEGAPALPHAELERLVSAIEHLETTLRDEHAATRGALTTGNGQAAALPSRPTSIDWPAWQELWGIYQGDEKAAADQVRLLTTDQLLQRYGPPTTMRGREDGSRMWYYYESDGGEPLSVTLRILDGYVTDVWMEL